MRFYGRFAAAIGAAVLCFGAFAAEQGDTLAAAKAAFQKNPSAISADALAQAFFKDGTAEQALDYFKARAPRNSRENPRLASACEAGAAAVFELQYDFEKAYTRYLAASELVAKIGDRGESAELQTRLGTVAANGGQLTLAVEHYREAIRMKREQGERRSEAKLLNNLGVVHEAMGRASEALDFFNQALAIRREIGDLAGIVNSLNGLGAAHDGLGRYAEAAAFYREALDIQESMPASPQAAYTLINLGVAFWKSGNYESAMHCQKRALEMSEAAGDLRGLAGALGNLALLYESMGDFSRSLESYRRALDIQRRRGDKRSEAMILSNMAGLLQLLGDGGAAARMLEESLPMLEAVGDARALAHALVNLGAMGGGGPEESHRHMERALALHTGIEDAKGIAHAEYNLAATAEAEGRLEEALAGYRRALETRRRIGEGAGEQLTLQRLGSLLVRTSAAEEGFSMLEDSLRLAEELDSPDMRSGAHAALAEACLMHGRSAEAVSHYRQAVESVESMRTLLAEARFRAGFLSGRLEAYEGLVEVLLTQQTGSSKPTARTADFEPSGYRPPEPGRSTEAFDVAEKMRARSFLDEIGTARFAREGVPPELMEKKRLLEARMKWLAERQ
jgi:tetratricopeptide (TPR) repeat protein